jgi:hypothetical protein
MKHGIIRNTSHRPERKNITQQIGAAVAVASIAAAIPAAIMVEPIVMGFAAAGAAVAAILTLRAPASAGKVLDKDDHESHRHSHRAAAS